MIETLARTKLPVLLLGETGCGKSHLAREIHAKSAFSRGPFVSINLCALASDLVESELFGHEKGAFTGAQNTRRGLLEQASGGTLFIDEVGEISPSLQCKLLLILEEGQFRPVGSERLLPLRCKLIFATNRTLETEVAQGNFRPDLYYRLAGFSYRLPSLKERIATDPHFIVKFYEELDAPHYLSPPLAEDCLQWMNARSWPGNLRQLKMALKTALEVRGEADKCLQLELLQATVASSEVGAHSEGQNTPVTASGTPLKYHDAVAEFERNYFERALTYYHGRINLISRELNVNKTTLLAKLRRYDMKAELYKTDVLQLVQGYA